MTVELGLSAATIIGVVVYAIRIAMKFQSMETNLINLQKEHCKDVEHLEEKLKDNKDSNEAHFNSLETKMDKIMDILMSLPKRDKD